MTPAALSKPRNPFDKRLLLFHTSQGVAEVHSAYRCCSAEWDFQHTTKRIAPQVSAVRQTDFRNTTTLGSCRNGLYGLQTHVRVCFL